MKKIVFIGGGSSKFVRELAIDLFLHEELKDSKLVLMDIDRQRLDISEKLVKKIIAEMGVPATCESTMDRRAAIKDADFVIITIMVGGIPKYKLDWEIPAKYGVYPTVGDTTGPGSLMRVVRTAPVLIGVAQEVEELAPNAWILNYANPMAMNTLTLLRAGHAKTVGLCHSIQGCVLGHFSEWLNIPASEIDYRAGGVNHIDFYLSLTHNGKDLYPEILAREKEILAKHPEEKVRFELLHHLGYFPAEGPFHPAEYYSWFMKDRVSADKYHSEIGWGCRVDSTGAETRQKEALAILDGTRKLDLVESKEYAAQVIHSLTTGSPLEIYGNVYNTGLIPNLPPNSVVEVPCMVVKDTIKPCYVGMLPPQLAAAMTPHLFLYEMGVEAAFRHDCKILLQALQVDPLSCAVLNLSQMEAMLNELCAANKEYMQDWK